MERRPALKSRTGRRDNLVEALLHACRSDPVLGAGGGVVVVGFSAGPDSSALLHALRRAAPALGLDLHAVHVDHGLRSASVTDAAAAEAFCSEVGVPLRVVRARPSGRSEAAARDARHQVLEAAAADLGAATVALGHTADDQAETVLLHLLRGTGLEGLAAMSPREGVRFRPLLRVWRRQVDAYCDRHRLAPRHDDSNHDTRFTRNRVRRELIPLLEAGYNPRVREAILRLADAARDEHDIVVAAAASWLEGQGRLLDRASFNRLPPALRAEALRRHWAARAGLDQPAGDGARIAQALAVIAADGDGMIHLGAGFELLAHGAEFEICPREGPAPALGR